MRQDTCTCNCHRQAERDAMDMEEHSDCGECATALDKEAETRETGETRGRDAAFWNRMKS